MPEPLASPRSTAMRVLGGVVAGLEKMSAVSGRHRPPIRAVDRSLPLVVADTGAEAEDVISLSLIRADGEPLPRWRPGAHLDLLLTSGRLRQYSLCGDPADRYRYRIAVLRIPDGGGGSVEAHRLRRGDRVSARGPRNAFPYLAVGRYLFVAGGIGITPIRPMVHDATRRGTDWSLVYTGRTRDSMAFADELTALDADRVQVRPDDEFGMPDARTILANAPTGAALYCCGPPPMIAAIRAEIPVEHISTLHFERFTPPPILSGEPFEIELTRSGRVVKVGADQSALAAIRAVLPGVAYSCQQGFCGTCPVRVVSGIVQHRDQCLSDDARKYSMAICVSRGAGRIAVQL